MEPRLFIATKAFIIHDEKVLVLREAGAYADGTNAAKYDVVGGRLQPGEHFAEALRREVKGETGLDVEIGTPFFVNEWRPVVRGEQWQIVGVFFRCEVKGEAAVVLSKDHDDFKWIVPEDFHQAGLIENLFPAFEAYLR